METIQSETGEPYSLHRGGIYNYFQGATIGNLVINGNMSCKETETESSKKSPEPETGELPSTQALCEAIMVTAKKGLWWSSRAWAVVYRVWQMKGYDISYAKFVSEVKSWNIDTGFECTYHAVQKPNSKGILAGSPDRWVKQGAPHQNVVLALALLEILD